MMRTYSLAFFRANMIKLLTLCLSLALYFALAVIAATLNHALPEIAGLPLQQIGVQTIVQKNGEIPGQMIGAIVPHSNAPIPAEQFTRISALPFVQEADMGLFFWYFDAQFFKAALGIDQQRPILTTILQHNIDRGSMLLGYNRVIITAAFSSKHGLNPGDEIALGNHTFTISGTLRPNISGNIIPADIYMDMSEARQIVRASSEMRKIYQLDADGFGNVVLLKGNPEWQGDREKMIKDVDKKLLVFSEKSFTREISNQLGIVSSAGRLLFLVLGGILAFAFAVLTLYTLKSRENEIAILRMLGWRIRDLKRQFIGESMVLLGFALLGGSILTGACLLLLGRLTITMELPWDISARPHFLPEENSIERVITAPLPVHFDGMLVLTVGIAFLLFFLGISLVCFSRIKHINPSEFSG